jgi:class 3 adenylate cyclase/pimeloyl-ACP methyl ester carboxylesterase
VVAAPPVRYARSGEVNIAHCRWGAGADVVVYTPPLVSNVELMWELPEWERALRHAGEHEQLIMIDKRGVGLSDRVPDAPTLEERLADTLAVMDAEGLDRAHLVGHSEGGAIAIALAALHPDRVCSLVLVGSPAFGAPADALAELADPDNPFPGARVQAEVFRDLVRHWGSPTSVNLALFAPSADGDPRIRRWYQRFERQSASPGAVLGFLRSFAEIDVTGFLSQLRTPAMVMHARGDRVVHVANGRFLASAIAGARYLEYPSDDHVWGLSSQWRSVEDAAIEFVTGRPPGPPVSSTFATVVFTDLVGSTAKEAELGDEAWRGVLDRHDRLGAELFAGRGGRLVKQTGDGLLATFPDPADAVEAALALSRELADLGLPIRAGVHAGRVEVRDDGDLSGITVNIAARVEGLAAPGEVLVSRTVRDLLLGSSIELEERGEHRLKGIEGAWQVYCARRSAQGDQPDPGR